MFTVQSVTQHPVGRPRLRSDTEGQLTHEKQGKSDSYPNSTYFLRVSVGSPAGGVWKSAHFCSSTEIGRGLVCCRRSYLDTSHLRLQQGRGCCRLVGKWTQEKGDWGARGETRARPFTAQISLSREHVCHSEGTQIRSAIEFL